MNDEILMDEVIQVVAIFTGGAKSCRPVRFRRANGREINITKVGLGFEHIQGARTMHIFDVSDGQVDYRLEFNSLTLVWRLTREADHV